MRWRGGSRGEDIEESFIELGGESVDEDEEERRFLPSSSHSGLDGDSFDLAELNAQTEARFVSNGHATPTQMACPQLKPRSTTSVHWWLQANHGESIASSVNRQSADRCNQLWSRESEDSPFASAHLKGHYHEEAQVSNCGALKSLA